MNPFQWITSNVKNQYEPVPISALTLIVGPEETGKTALGLDSVRLALTGRHRIGHNPSDLLQLAANPNRGIDVKLEGPSGTAHWSLQVGSDGKAKRPESPRFTGELDRLTPAERERIIPTYGVQEFLAAKGQKKIREAILRRWGGASDALQEPFGLSPEERKAWQDGITVVSAKLEERTSSALLAGLTETFRSLALQRSRMVKPLQTEIDRKKAELRAGTKPPDMLPILERQVKAIEDRSLLRKVNEEIVRLSEEHALIQSQHDGLIATEADRVVQHKAMMDALEERLRESNRELLRREGAFEALLEKTATQKMLVRKMRSIMDAGHSKCPICQSPDAPIHDLLETFTAALGSSQGSVDDARKASEQVRDDVRRVERELDQMVDENKRRVRESQQMIVYLKQSVADLHTRLNEAQEQAEKIEARLKLAPKIAEDLTLEAVQADIRAINDVSAKRAELEREAMRLRALEDEAKMYGLLERQAAEQQKDVLAQISARASEEVSARMLGGRRVEFDAETCEWYIINEKGRFPYGGFCGTEETAFKLAFACAWTAGNPLRVAAFDDSDLVGLSQRGMSEFFSMCETLVARGDLHQIIVAWNRVDEAPKTGQWTVLETSKKAPPRIIAQPTA